jgi:hypothetical protein
MCPSLGQCGRRDRPLRGSEMGGEKEETRINDGLFMSLWI